MGRHSRIAAEPVVIRRSGSHRKVKAGLRKRPPVRTGLMTSCAALAVAAVGVSAGLLPVPNGSGGFAFSDVGSTGQVQPDSAARTSPWGGTATAQPGKIPMWPGPSAKRPSMPTPSVTRTVTVTAIASPPRSSSKETTPRFPVATSSPFSSQPAVELNVKNTETQVVNLVNEQRAKVGCAPVTADRELGKLADDLSKDMAKRNFFGHIDPDGNNPWDRAGLLGILNLGGENIARGQLDATAVMDAWMHSAGHRANILNCDFRTLGIGFAPAKGGPWWTQDFGY
jgi:uncharacterized protein YkwD